jgi:hypothetical protein
MKRFLPLTLVLGLCACSQLSSVVSDAQKACTAATPVLNVATSSTNPTAQQLGYSGQVLCTAAATGNAPTADANTPNWLGTVVGDILPLIQVGMAVAPLL